MASKRDIQRDARQRAREVPIRDVAETIEALEAALEHASGDLKLWLEASLDELRQREHLSTVNRVKNPSRSRKISLPDR